METAVTTIPCFYVQGLLFGNEVEGAVCCPICSYTFNIPLDWWTGRIGDRVSCPSCSCVAALPDPGVA